MIFLQKRVSGFSSLTTEVDMFQVNPLTDLVWEGKLTALGETLLEKLVGGRQITEEDDGLPAPVARAFKNFCQKQGWLTEGCSEDLREPVIA